MPLPNDPWTRLRSHLKVRQYMGLGIPCVGSPVGIMGELIDDGKNGFLAHDEDEWVAKLTRLLDDAALRRKIGAAGRATIVERYSASLWAPRVLEILREAAHCRAAPSLRSRDTPLRATDLSGLRSLRHHGHRA